MNEPWRPRQADQSRERRSCRRFFRRGRQSLALTISACRNAGAGEARQGVSRTEPGAREPEPLTASPVRQRHSSADRSATPSQWSRPDIARLLSAKETGFLQCAEMPENFDKLCTSEDRPRRTLPFYPASSGRLSAPRRSCAIVRQRHGQNRTSMTRSPRGLAQLICRVLRRRCSSCLLAGEAERRSCRAAPVFAFGRGKRRAGLPIGRECPVLVDSGR